MEGVLGLRDPRSPGRDGRDLRPEMVAISGPRWSRTSLSSIVALAAAYMYTPACSDVSMRFLIRTGLVAAP